MATKKHSGANGQGLCNRLFLTEKVPSIGSKTSA